MKRLLLISPAAPTSLFGSHFDYKLPCLGLLKVAALTPPDWDILIKDENVEAINFDQEVDLVGITSMTCTANRAYEIADRFREQGTRVVMGGMHASSMPTEALRHADSIVIGEAESTWPQVVGDAEASRIRQIYRSDPCSLQGLPSVRWDLYRGKGYLPVHFVETTRGCPLDCEFCAVTTFFGGTYRNRPLGQVLAELKGLRAFGGFAMKNVVFFVDDNIVSNRNYTRELLIQLADLDIQWLGHACVNLASDSEILALCQKSRCLGVLIGFETLSSTTMKSIGKKSRLSMEYADAIQKIHDHGIAIDGSFVFGFDSDDEGVFDRTLEFVIKTKIEIPYFSILTPYPGTRLNERLERENRILHRNWALYDTGHVVFKPQKLTPDQLQDGYLRAFHEAYSRSRIAERLQGTNCCRHLFVPMNFGIRDAVERFYRGGGRACINANSSSETKAAIPHHVVST